MLNGSSAGTNGMNPFSTAPTSAASPIKGARTCAVLPLARYDCLVRVCRQEGLLALWSGTLPSVVLASNPAIVFMVYEALKRSLQLHLHSTELSGILYFVIGAIAKTVATIVTYPLQVIQSRLRAGLSRAEKSQSMLQHLMLLARRQGVGFLYKGMEAKLLQTVLTAALMFLTYEKLSAFIFSLMGISPKAAR